MNSFNQSVYAQHLEPVPRRFHNCRIVANADGQPIGSWRKPCFYGVDELGFGQFGDGVILA